MKTVTLRGLLAVGVGVVLASCSASGNSNDLGTPAPTQVTVSSSSLPSLGPKFPLPTLGWHPPMPMEGAVGYDWLSADGQCVVAGKNPPYQALVWPRGWYGRRATSGEITVFTATGRKYATTGAPAGWGGSPGGRNGGPFVIKAHDRCVTRYHSIAWYVQEPNSGTGQSNG